MKKYTSSELVEMAMKRADITNTDFLDHDEITKYLNESWKTVYQFLINKGDKQFVEEARLNGGSFGGTVEYDLPDDFYQMLSLRNNSGFCIPRKSESEGNQSGTYEIVNDKLRLYGATGPLTLTYYTTPVWITYPDKEIPIDSFPSNITPTLVYKNSVGYMEDNVINVKNILTKELVASFASEDGYNILGIGNGSVVTYKIGTGSSSTIYYKWYDFDGNEIGNTSETYRGLHPVTYKGMPCVVTYNNSELRNIRFAGDTIKTLPSLIYSPMLTGTNIYIDDEIIYDVNGGKGRVYKYAENNPNAIISPDYMDKVWRRDGNTLYTIYGHEVITWNFETGEYNKLDYVNPKGILEYGVVEYTGYNTLKSIEEDTIFNFPNELYISLIADDLAIRFMFKMNAENSGLINQYEVDKAAFKNTLSQDGSYTRIRNAYRR